MLGTAASNIRPLRRPSESHAAYERRWKMIWSAELQVAEAQIPCALVDLSVSGAAISMVEGLADADRVSLIIKKCQPISARVVWRRADRVGLFFLERQPWILRLVTNPPKG
ncbi:MAG TPA: PilZ domain-containing protein [Stellaceae bacterium]|nr:PilZ domain-containing protein [Stellaceae bacterium]